MAKPRIFISSTYYDLKHIRSSLEKFIESLGYEAVLSEKGDIAYSPDIPLDESCYREARKATVFILIIGGRYGSKISSENNYGGDKFYNRYESITKKEFSSAISVGVPTYILIEKSVYSEYITYLQNRKNDKIVYAHVDSVNIFMFIDDILSLPRNNPVQTFEKYVDIEVWLREQWAGLFRDFLENRFKPQQSLNLTERVNELSDINDSLRTYIEAILKKVAPNDFKNLISSEKQRLQERKIVRSLRNMTIFDFLENKLGFNINNLIDKIKNGRTIRDVFKSFEEIAPSSEAKNRIIEIKKLKTERATADINEARKIIGCNVLKH